MRKALSASSPWPDFSTAQASKRCATICAAPARKFGSSIARQKGISRSPDTHLSRRAAAGLHCACCPQARQERRTAGAGAISEPCRRARGRRNSKRSPSCRSMVRTGPIVRAVGAIHSCRRQPARGRLFLRSKTSSFTTVQASCRGALGLLLPTPVAERAMDAADQARKILQKKELLFHPHEGADKTVSKGIKGRIGGSRTSRRVGAG